MIKFIVRRINYYKRREPTPTREVDSISVPDFQFEHYHSCSMIVNYSDGETVTLRAQVLQNPVVKTKWSVSGHDTNYNHVIADVTQEVD